MRAPALSKVHAQRCACRFCTAKPMLSERFARVTTPADWNALLLGAQAAGIITVLILLWQHAVPVARSVLAMIGSAL